MACQSALTLAGFPPVFFVSPEGVHVSDIPTVTTAAAAYAGSAAELIHEKAQAQIALDAEFDANFDLAKFIRGGTATGVTAAQVGTFIAMIANNYRTLRGAIASAANVAAVNSINIAGGWPSNP